MKRQDDLVVLKVGAGFFGLVATLVLVVSATALFLSSPANASYRYYKAPGVSDALDANGFETLKFALDATGLTPVLDSNRVTLFAPTNDVFESTAQALGCHDALDLATRLLNIPVGDSNALAVVLTHHAVLGVIRTNYKLLKSSPIETVSTDEVTTGVNSEGLYVQGAANDTPSSITVEGIRGYRWVIYPIDAILLPFAPPSDLCS
jgi:uncharacterized surface protein with fasciclin (FAS1) repeats